MSLYSIYKTWEYDFIPISSYYVMEACAENNVNLIILDRPNPNGFYIEWTYLDLEFRSFVGMHQSQLLQYDYWRVCNRSMERSG